MDKQLLSILVCPVSKAPLEYEAEAQELVCRASGLGPNTGWYTGHAFESEARQLKADEKLRSDGK